MRAMCMRTVDGIDVGAFIEESSAAWIFVECIMGIDG